MKTRTSALCLIVIFVAFVGFCIENTFTAYSYGIISNKNMILPFLLGYGLTILGFNYFFGTPNEPLFFKRKLSIKNKFLAFIYYFVIAFLCVCIGEIILGYFMEWTCGIVWWNYSELPLHVTKYTAVPTSSIFALLITIFMKWVFTPLLNLFSKINPKISSFIAVFFMFLLIIDFIHSGLYMFKYSELLEIWKINLPYPLKEIFIKIKGG